MITGLGLLLLVYSAARSLDFIALTLPADKAILAYFGLAALDGGIIAWLLSFMHGSHGYQRVIALVMILVDFLGAVAMFTLDTLYNSGRSGMTAQLDQMAIQNAVLALSIIIAANIGATIMHHLADPANLRAMAEEEAKDKIEDMALAEVRQNAGALAAELAPQIGKAWMEQERSNYQTVLKGRKKTPALPETAAPAMTILAQETRRQELSLPETAESAFVVEVPEKANPIKPARKSRKTES